MAGTYMPAFAVVRSALEHHLVDQLLFLGRRYRRVVADMKRTDFDAWRHAWKSRKTGTETVTRLGWISKATALIGSVKVVQTGIHQHGGRIGRFARALSIYHLLLRDHNPPLARPRISDSLSENTDPSRST
jgi:hypothetical protein